MSFSGCVRVLVVGKGKFPVSIRLGYHCVVINFDNSETHLYSRLHSGQSVTSIPRGIQRTTKIINIIIRLRRSKFFYTSGKKKCKPIKLFWLAQKDIAFELHYRTCEYTIVPPPPPPSPPTHIFLSKWVLSPPNIGS